MRAMYSFAFIFALLVAACAQDSTTETPNPASVDGSSTAATTDKMQNDDPAAASPSGADTSAAPAASDATTTAGPPIIHTSVTDAVPDEGSKTPAADTTKSETTNATTKATGANTTAAPGNKDNSAAGIHSSIACLLISVLPAFFLYQS